MRSRTGFSLVEMMATLVVLGLIAAFTFPAFNRSLTEWNLRTGRNTVMSELKLLRQKAITRGQNLRIWFSPTTDMYWFQDPQSGAWTMYRLPNRVTFQTVSFLPGGVFDTFMQPDGRSLRSGTIILANTKGVKDTVMVDLSGWVGRP